MSMSLRRIFWPVNSTKGRDTPGWVVGWMNSANDYFVFAVLDEESVKVHISSFLLIQTDPSRSSSSPVILSSRHLALFTYDLYDSRPLEILGTLTYENRTPSNQYISSRARLKLQAAIDPTCLIPRITFFDKVEIQVILYTPPNPHEMQFFSLTPITLDLAASDQQVGRRRADSVVIDERDELETVRMDNLVAKMALHFPKRQGLQTQGAEILKTSIDQVRSLCSTNSRSTVHGNCRICCSETINRNIPSQENEH